MTRKLRNENRNSLGYFWHSTIKLTCFFPSIRGAHEHASWAQLRTWNARPECAWTVSETSFTSPRWCPSDVRPSRASREAPHATVSSAYLISLYCQSAHKPRPLNPPRPSGRTEPRVAQSCRLMHTHSGVCEEMCTKKTDRYSVFMGESYCPIYGPWDCTAVWIHYTEEFYLLTSSLLLFLSLWYCLADLSVTNCVKQMQKE